MHTIKFDINEGTNYLGSTTMLQKKMIWVKLNMSTNVVVSGNIYTRVESCIILPLVTKFVLHSEYKLCLVTIVEIGFYLCCVERIYSNRT